MNEKVKCMAKRAILKKVGVQEEAGKKGTCWKLHFF